MLNILRKTAASMAKSGRSTSAEQNGVVFVADDDLSAWELVDAPPSDDDDLRSLDTDDDVTSGGDHRDDDVIGNEPEAKQAVEEDGEEEDARESRDLASPGDVIFMESVSVPVQLTLRDDLYDDYGVDSDGGGYESYDDDDEVLAWKVEERLGKARTTKKTAAKRGGGGRRSEKSKRRLPYYYNRPGCLHGKHGLGVQNSYI